MANTYLKTEYGLQVEGESTLNGNVAVQNTSTLTANTIMPVSGNSGTLGNSSLQWNLSGNTGSFSNTLTVTGNVTVNSGSFAVVVGQGGGNTKIGVNMTPDLANTDTAMLTVNGTITTIGNANFGNTLYVSGNTVVGPNVLFVSTASGFERIGIRSNTAAINGINYTLQVQGNVAIKDGHLRMTNGYIETDQLKINSSGGLQLGENVALTFAGLIVGDVIPAWDQGVIRVNTVAGNRTVTVAANTGSPNTPVDVANLNIKYVMVDPLVFPANTRVESFVNSTAFTVTLAPIATVSNEVVEYYSNYENGALASYALGRASDVNKRWEIYSKQIINNADITLGGTLIASNDAVTHTFAGNVAFDVNTLYVDAANNRVGVNESAPKQALSVVGTANITGNSFLSNTITLTSNSSVSLANVSGRMTLSGNLAVNSTVLVATSNTSAVRVGVNTSSPDATLTVNGTVNVAANVNFGNTLFVAGNTKVGNSTSFVLLKTNGALEITREIEIGNTSIYSNTQPITTAGANVIIDTFNTAEYDTAKYIISYHSTSNSQVFGATELLLIHNGVTVITTEYATVFSSNIAFSIDASIPTSSTNCHIYASANQGNLQVTSTRITMI